MEEKDRKGMLQLNVAGAAEVPPACLYVCLSFLFLLYPHIIQDAPAITDECLLLNFLAQCPVLRFEIL